MMPFTISKITTTNVRKKGARPASHDPESAKNIFASEKAMRPLSSSVNKNKIVEPTINRSAVFRGWARTHGNVCYGNYMGLRDAATKPAR
jgi:hypothetical protein